jgi:RHS repeat-associated protein
MLKKFFISALFYVFCNIHIQAQSYTATIQTGVEFANLKSNFPNTNFSQNEELSFGKSAQGDTTRTLIKFNFGTLPPGIEIISANLHLYGIGHDIVNTSSGVLKLVDDSWNSNTANWSNANHFYDAETQTLSLSAPNSQNQNYVLDVKTMVQKMVNTPLINFGWMLYSSNESSHDFNFQFASPENSNPSLRPKIEITYCKKMVANMYVSPSTDFNTSNAGVNLSITGGVPPYQYLWNNAATTKDVYNLMPGVYGFTVTDARGIQIKDFVLVSPECGNFNYTVTAYPNGFASETQLLKNNNNNNIENTNFLSADRIKASYKSINGDLITTRNLIAFDLNSLPSNATITSAYLKLTDDEPTHSGTFKLHLKRVVDKWQEETATFNVAPNASDTTDDIVEFDYDGSQSQYVLDVTNQLQKMIRQVGSQKGWLLKLKDENSNNIENSASFIGTKSSGAGKPTLEIAINVANYACNDALLNWKQEDTYDENGNILSSEKVYLDNMGRVTQTLNKNATNEVFTSQTLYDSYGDPVIGTLPAYSGNQLKYYPGFMRNQTGQVYSYNDFDTPSTLNNPSIVQTGNNNTLGNYYSNLNPYDAYQAIADNPYTRVQPLGGIISVGERISKPGNAYKMGNGKEDYSFTMMTGDELKYVYGMNGSNYNSYKAYRLNSGFPDCSPITSAHYPKARKTISISPDNIETITYYVGNTAIASCYSGLNSSEVYTGMNVTNIMEYGKIQATEINLPQQDIFTFQILLPTNNQIQTTTNQIHFTITDLFTGDTLTKNIDYYYSAPNVTFDQTFINKYAPKSLMLRVSFKYNSGYVAGLLSSNINPSNVEVKYHLSYGRYNKNFIDLGGALRKSVSAKGFNLSNPTNITMATTYDYDHNGQLIATKSPDEGLKEYVYDKEGKLRFSQNDKQKGLFPRFSFVNYDKHGRVIQSGEFNSSYTSGSAWFTNYYNSYTPSSSGIINTNAILDLVDGLLTADKTYVTTVGYEVPVASGSDDIPNSYTYYNNYRQFRNGQVNFVKNENSIWWYNYDKVGRSTAIVNQITEPNFVAKTNSIDDQIKTSMANLNYYTGLPNYAEFQTNNSNEKLKYQFTFDVNHRLINTLLTTGPNGNGVGISENLNKNYYNKLGQLNRTVLGNKYQGIDYVYTLNGGLKAINHPGLDASSDPGHDIADYTGTDKVNVNKDIFGEIIEYYNNDYQRNGTNINSSISALTSKYNGLIYATRFKTRNTINNVNTGSNYVDFGGTNQTQIISTSNYQAQELRFDYTYDEFNQLAQSHFGTYNNVSDAITQRSEYSETGQSAGNIGYDKNGNISHLVRKAFNNTDLDNLTYNYSSNLNQLSSITDAAVNSFPQSFNFKTPSTSAPSSFVYNSIGQLIQSAAENISNIAYEPSGKIKLITYNNGNTAEYAYGANGEKLLIKYFDNSLNKTKFTWYVGPYVYEFDESNNNSFEIKEVRVMGGVLRMPSNSSNHKDVNLTYMVYHIKDHLGNVRASFKGVGIYNAIDILSYNDYYAFGGELPGRKWQSEEYSYAYQGKEKSKDGTNWDQFELRNFNHDLGRWFAPDPYNEFASPYIAMANNPISVIDPNGGQINPLFFVNGYGRMQRGRLQDEYDRNHASGAYTSKEIQKRYEAEYEQLRNHFLHRDDFGRDNEGMTGNIAGYMNAMLELNNFYAGLTASFNSGINVSMATGVEYLTQNQIALNIEAVSNSVGGTLLLQPLKELADDAFYTMQDYLSDKKAYMDNMSSRAFPQIVRSGNSTKVWSHGNDHDLDDEMLVSTTTTSYFTDGMVVVLENDGHGHINISIDFTNNNFAGGGLEVKNNAATEPKLNNIVAQSNGGVPFGEKGSIPGLPDIAPNMFPGVGIEVNTLATITGRGYYDNKTKTLQLPIGAKTSYAQHEYGHYLQSKQMPASCYKAVENASFKNAMLQFLPWVEKHDTFWTERDANRRSIEYFGPNSEIAKFGLWPQ